MKTKLIFRILSILFSILALILLIFFWKRGYKNYSFVSLLLVAIALIFSSLSQFKN